MKKLQAFSFSIIASAMVGLAGIGTAGPGTFPVPRGGEPIIDEAGLLSKQTQSLLDESLRAIHGETGLQLAVLIVRELGGVTIEEAGIKVAEAWGLGTAKDDRGAIIVIAVAEKKARIEVGQGLEGELPDALAKRIITERMAPLMRTGDPDGAVTVGLYSIAQAAFPDRDMSTFFEARGRNQEIAPSRPLNKLELAVIITILLWLLFTRSGRTVGALLIAASASGSRRGGRLGGGWSSGSSRGSYSGGGGGFSGGGASGGW